MIHASFRRAWTGGKPDLLSCIIATAVAAIGLPVIFLAWVLLGPVTKNRSYETLQEAQEQGLFSHGWLPAFLPNSSRNLQIEANTDIYTARGRFTFSPTELQLFRYQLGRSPRDRFVAGEAEEIRELKDAGYEDHCYANSIGSWRILVHPTKGKCRFWANFVHGKPLP